MRVLKVLVKPNSPKTEILEESPEQMKIAVAAPAENGRANLELIKFLSKRFNSQVEIVAGKTSKRKLVKLSG